MYNMTVSWCVTDNDRMQTVFFYLLKQTRNCPSVELAAGRGLEATTGNREWLLERCWGSNTEKSDKQESTCRGLKLPDGVVGPTSLHLTTFFLLCKSTAAGQERCANAVRNKGMFSERRRHRWREEAGTNQLWFSVSCWELHIERSCSCGLGRSVKPKEKKKKKVTPTPFLIHHFCPSLFFIYLLLFFPPSSTFIPPLFHMSRAASKLQCSLSYYLARSLSD